MNKLKETNKKVSLPIVNEYNKDIFYKLNNENYYIKF